MLKIELGIFDGIILDFIQRSLLSAEIQKLWKHTSKEKERQKKKVWKESGTVESFTNPWPQSWRMKTHIFVFIKEVYIGFLFIFLIHLNIFLLSIYLFSHMW